MAFTPETRTPRSRDTPRSHSMSPKPSFSSTLRSDLPASLVVFLVALPLCLGIALASGAPLVAGIVAGVVGGVVVGALSGSQLGVSGPAAGLAVIVLTSIQELGSFDIFLVAVVLAGLIQIGLGFARAGIIAYYFPSSVITGMLSGIGIIILLKQIPHAFGYDKDPIGELSFHQPDGETTFSELGHLLDSVSFGPVLITLVSLAILILWESRAVRQRAWLAIVPGPLLAVVAGTLLNLLFRTSANLALTPDQMVALPEGGGMGGIGHLLTFPDFSGLGTMAVYKTAVVLAAVASLETLLSVEAADKLDPLRRVTPTNRELKAQGIGNMVSGCFGGLPVTQVIVRSSANVQSGAKTKASAIVHGFLLAGSVIVLPAVMNLIPLATLAAILCTVGYKLAKPSVFKRMFKQGAGQFIPFVATVLGIVFTNLLLGIGIGLHVAVIVILFESFQLPFQISAMSKSGGEHVCITLAQQVTFLNKASVLKALDTIPDGSTVDIDASASVFIHQDVIEIIDNFEAGASARDIEVVVKNLDHHKQTASTGMKIAVDVPSGTCHTDEA
ncbi:MAG: MFS superfamily sulfate permease-like transporter [Chlamydiales bacterium]|jgi:MFS superfamily sulfate permease-like transporter